MYITSSAYRQQSSPGGCLSGCGVQTSARRLGFSFTDFLKAAPVVAQGAATVTAAAKGGGKSGAAPQAAPSGASGAGINFLDSLSSTELAIGGIAGLGLVLALVR